MIFNEYTDILDNGEVVFLDEENLYHLMLEGEEPQGKVPSNGLDSNDSTATAEERSNPTDKTGQPQNNSNQQQSKGSKEASRGLMNWFSVQKKKFSQFYQDQSSKLKGRIDNLTDKLNKAPKDYDGDDQVEVPQKAAGTAPRMRRPSGDDPAKWEEELNRFKQETAKYEEENKKKSKMKSFLKGAGIFLGGKAILKQISKMSGELEINMKDGIFYTSFGHGKASQAANGGGGFLSALAHVVKNVFLAILVLIGGIFKVLKEYFVALGKIIATIFGTVGQAGKTLVTGQMPSKA